MDTPSVPQTIETQSTDQSQPPIVVPPVEPVPSHTKSKHQKRVTLFFSMALIAAVGIFGLITMLVVRSPKTSPSEAKQQKYNATFDQLSPSTSQVQTGTKLEEVSEVDAIHLDDLDSNFTQVDADLNKL